jgi:hypothetical protein
MDDLIGDSLSRYITRASAERQLHLTNREAPLVSRLLVDFIHSLQLSSEDQSKLLVLHEVRREEKSLPLDDLTHLSTGHESLRSDLSRGRGPSLRNEI